MPAILKSSLKRLNFDFGLQSCWVAASINAVSNSRLAAAMQACRLSEGAIASRGHLSCCIAGQLRRWCEKLECGALSTDSLKLLKGALRHVGHLAHITSLCEVLEPHHLSPR
jgi:hypothetical protein